MIASCGEFELITRYFNRSAQGVTACYAVEKGIGDDCALVNIPHDKTLAISTDTLVEGIHFLQDIHPADLAHKALAVNLSDLAAMGADPAWLTLNLTLPNVNESWLSSFSDSLFECLDNYHMRLIGGDTTRGPLSVTMSVYGIVPLGCALSRDGARSRDKIYVTGTLGDSAVGLALLKGGLSENLRGETGQFFIERHLRPTPRIRLGRALRGIASSAIDISDGLISDLRHILKKSRCGARVHLDALPLSPVLLDHLDPQKMFAFALSGGEDYELCFTVPPNRLGALDTALSASNVPFTCVGEVTSAPELVFLQADSPVDIPLRGFDHFE